MAAEFYAFKAQQLFGPEITLDWCRGKVVLVVNTASKCGFTPQYAGLEKLYQTYKADGFEILAFPCNQFGRQEPWDAGAIRSFCMSSYNVTFPVFAKNHVNGKKALPLFSYLKSALPGAMGARIKWNFTKFLIGRDGTPMKRFAPVTKPEKLVPDITRLLKGA